MTGNDAKSLQNQHYLSPHSFYYFIHLQHRPKTCMQAGIWKAKCLFSVHEKNESLLPTHTHTQKNKPKDRGRSGGRKEREYLFLNCEEDYF